jgi:hypothetical protein
VSVGNTEKFFSASIRQSRSPSTSVWIWLPAVRSRWNFANV